MDRQKNLGNQTGKKERLAYCLFFLGQNILWGYAGYVETYLTDIGVAAAAAADPRCYQSRYFSWLIPTTGKTGGFFLQLTLLPEKYTENSYLGKMQKLCYTTKKQGGFYGN